MPFYTRSLNIRGVGGWGPWNKSPVDTQRMTVQLTLEQHRFELCRSIYTCIFCNKYTHNPGLVESMHVESLVWRANYGILASKDFVIHSKSWNQYSHSSVQSLSCVQLFVTLWTTAHQASLSITNSQGPPKHMSIESIKPSNHLTVCCPLLLLPSIFPSIRVFSNESALHIRWPEYWSFSVSVDLPLLDMVYT